MVNLFLLLFTVLSLGLMGISLPSELTLDSIQLLIGGLALYNNLTTFSLLSFFDHFLSEPKAAPLIHFFTVPVFSAGGEALTILRHLGILSYILCFVFAVLLFLEMRKNGKWMRSRAVQFSLLLFILGYWTMRALNASESTRWILNVLLMILSLFYYRYRAEVEFPSDAKKRLSGWRRFQVALMFYILADLRSGLLVLIVTSLFEYKQKTAEARHRLVGNVWAIFGWKKQPLLLGLAGVFFGGWLYSLLGTSRSLLLPSQWFYIAFLIFTVRGFLLYHKSFLELVHSSAEMKASLVFLFFPLSLWLLYPEPNRFEALYSRAAYGASEKLDRGDPGLIQNILLPLLADDRRIQIFGISEQAAKCELLNFELKRAFPDWSRNPEPRFCFDRTVVPESKRLEMDYRARRLRTIVVFYPPRHGVPFEVPLFIKNANVEFEKIPFMFKEWGLAGAVFYLAEP